ncbi:MAG: sulfatase [Planctomycetaceae bacterium]
MSGPVRCLAVLLGLLVTRDLTAEETRPNIVLILVDDLGWADLGCYGADLHETPNIDRLAEQGMRFTDGYAAAAICSPTRASIMSGKYPARLNFTIWHEYAKNPPPSNHRLNPAVSMDHLAREEFTLAEALKEVGYNTLHVGKWHLGDAAFAPESHGFDVNIGGTHWGAPTTFHWPYRGLFGSEREWRYVPDLPFGQEGEYLTDRLTDEALRLIERVKDEPFYLNLWFHTVHTPIEAKAKDIAEYEDKLQENFHHQNPTYAAMVHSLDENVGRVVHKLDELGLSENTIVIFTSDNGGTIREYDGLQVTTNHPLRSGKGSLYEGGLRVPFIVDWPGVTHADTVCDQMVCSTDLYPTILSMAGTTGDPAHNQTVDGIDLTGLLRDPSTSLDRETLYFHYPHYYPTTTPVSAIRDGDWKLLEYFEDGHTELYNLADDLGEEHDLSTSMPELTGSLHQKLVDWRESVGARLPTKRE